jgi:predicted dehydrogenase
MEAFLGLVAEGKVRPSELVTHRFHFDDAQQAFAELTSGNDVVGIVLEYARSEAAPRQAPSPPRARRRTSAPRIGLIGAGSFATATIVPGLQAAGFELGRVASASGLTAESARQRFGFESAHADPAEVIDSDVDLVVIATRHDSHAELAAAALAAGKAVYVEKPLALDAQGLAAVADAASGSGAPLIVGFNRRYAPLADAVRVLDHPRLMTYRVNAGRLAADHWTNDLAIGGGRLRGEGCHFVDFLCDQAGADPVEVSAHAFASIPDLPLAARDNFSVRVVFANGSVGTVNYAAESPAGPGKERFETSAPGVYAVIDDFRTGSIWRGAKRERLGGRSQDKGWDAQYKMLAGVLRGEIEPPALDGYLLSTLATLAAVRSLETGQAEAVCA